MLGAHPSPNFIGVKKSEIWPRFLTPVAFDTLWFRNGATHRKAILMLRTMMNVLYPCQIWCSLVYPTLNTTPDNIASLKNAPGHLVVSSITQLWVVRFCCDLACESEEGAETLKCNPGQIQDGGWAPKFVRFKLLLTPLQCVRFCYDLVQSLITWQPIHCKHTKGQRSRSQHDVTDQP